MNIPALVEAMAEAAAPVLGDAWTEARAYAETEFRKFGETVELIARLREAGAIDEERARLHLEFQKTAMKTVLLALEGLGIVAVERSINAALGAVRDVVNGAVGFPAI